MSNRAVLFCYLRRPNQPFHIQGNIVPAKMMLLQSDGNLRQGLDALIVLRMAARSFR